MLNRHERGEFVWIDLQSPTREELRTVMNEFSIEPEVEAEIITPTLYPLMKVHPKHAYLILHFPTADLAGGPRNQEIDIIAGKNFLITARYEMVRSIEALNRAFEAKAFSDISEKEAAPIVVERVVRRLYQAMSEETERVARTLDHIENDIFSGKERQTVRAISEAGRILLRFETTLARHAEPLDAFLSELQSSFFGKGFSKSIERINAERSHVASLVGAYRAVARELRTTNDSLLSASQNESLKIFTMITVAFLPLSFIAGLFGMHAKNAPLLGHSYDFSLILILMLVVELILLLFMRLKKWI